MPWCCWKTGTLICQDYLMIPPSCFWYSADNILWSFRKEIFKSRRSFKGSRWSMDRLSAALYKEYNDVICRLRIIGSEPNDPNYKNFFVSRSTKYVDSEEWKCSWTSCQTLGNYPPIFVIILASTWKIVWLIKLFHILHFQECSVTRQTGCHLQARRKPSLPRQQRETDKVITALQYEGDEEIKTVSARESFLTFETGWHLIGTLPLATTHSST